MTYSLIEQLPEIAAAGRKDAEEVLARANASRGASLQVDEYVIPARGSVAIGKDGWNKYPVWYNRLFYGDNLIIMEALLAGDPPTNLPSLKGKIDLICIDPPFATDAGYQTSCILPGTEGREPFLLEQQAYNDSWEDGLAGYLRMLYPRLFLMRELLGESGSLIVHLDWHAVHYVKILLDEIFGPENFRNEIAWCYGGGGAPQRTYPKKHDLLLWYTKGSTWTFNRQYRPYTGGTLQRGLTAVKGDKYELHPQGAGLDDWWAGKDVQKILSPTAFENLKFGTQKPEGLLTRIIAGHSNKGDLVADFFCGTGTTAAVAGRLGRRWIAADISKQAFMISYKRLAVRERMTFICQSPGNYPGLLVQRSSVRKSARDLPREVLDLFGVVPFPGRQYPGGALGYLDKSKTLVLVAAPAERIDRHFLKKAQGIKESLPGRWEKFVVLGWDLETDIIDIILEQNEKVPEVLLIQPCLLDEGNIHTKGRKLLQRNRFYFSPLRCLTLKEPVVKDYSQEYEEIIIELDNYRFLSPDYLPVNGDAGERVHELLDADPLALIEYWSVDPDFDGGNFCSKWQGSRGEGHRVCPVARLLVPRVEGTRMIGVKAVDAFGYESRAVSQVCSYGCIIEKNIP